LECSPGVLLSRTPGFVANTVYYKTHVEPYVREQLERLHGQGFSSKVCRLTTGGTHEFDAVSDDATIVASIKSLSGKTATGKNPAGKIYACFAELYFLTLVEAPRRMLVLTTPDFHEIFTRNLRGRLYPGITVELIVVSPEIQAEIDRIKGIASEEVSPVLGSLSTL